MAAVLYRQTDIPVFDSNGAPVSGALAYFYLTGTLTLTPVYSDSDLTIEHTNPVEANSSGVLPAIYLDSSVTYRARITDPDGVVISDNDPYADLSQQEIIDKLDGADLSFDTLRLTSTTEADLSSTEHAFQIGATASANLAADANEIQARNNGSAATLELNPAGGTVNIGGIAAMVKSLSTTGVNADQTLTPSMNFSARRVIGATNRTWTIAPEADGAWVNGSMLIVFPSGGGNLVISRGSGVSMTYGGSNGDRTISSTGFGILIRGNTANEWYLIGVGIT